MAFPNNWILSGGNVVSFADFDSVKERDQRLFEANEGIDNADIIEPFAERATTKILYEIKDTDWWQSYFLLKDGGTTNVSTLSFVDVPLPFANKIEGRQQDFTDLCVFLTLFEYVLPKVADFTNVDAAEYKKIGFYREKYQSLFRQLINAGDWYDFDGSGAITNADKMPTKTNIVRIR